MLMRRLYLIQVETRNLQDADFLNAVVKVNVVPFVLFSYK